MRIYTADGALAERVDGGAPGLYYNLQTRANESVAPEKTIPDQAIQQVQ